MPKAGIKLCAKCKSPFMARRSNAKHCPNCLPKKFTDRCDLCCGNKDHEHPIHNTSPGLGDGYLPCTTCGCKVMVRDGIRMDVGHFRQPFITILEVNTNA